MDTGLIGRKQEALTTIPAPGDEVIATAALAAADVAKNRDPSEPWSSLVGYAHFHAGARNITLKAGENTITARITARSDGGFDVATDDGIHSLRADGGKRLARWPEHVTVFSGATGYNFGVPDPLARADDAGAGTGNLRAPMPGLVKVVRSGPGETVVKGQPLLILEAMKMEHTIAAPHDGTIAEIAAEGAQVTDGTVLVKFVETDA